MKVANVKMLQTSEQKGVWATSTSIERKIAAAFADGKVIFLIFSVHGSGHFQGFARVTDVISSASSREQLAPGLLAAFSIEWLRKANVAFQQCQHLVNPWSDNKKVISSKDGQELEPTVGEQLLSLWSKTSMPVGVQQQQQTRQFVAATAQQGFVFSPSTGTFIPPEYATAQLSQQQRSTSRPQVNQYPGWTATSASAPQQSYGGGGAGSSSHWGIPSAGQRQPGYPVGSFPQECATTVGSGGVGGGQQMAAQYAYALQQKGFGGGGLFPAQIAAGASAASAAQHGAVGGSSVVILQRSSGSDMSGNNKTSSGM
jgi:hypothetical protein